MKIAVHQPNFLPYLGFFDKAMKVDKFIFMDNFQYTKRGFINRNRIKTPEGFMWINVPVSLTGTQNINEVKISPGDNWKNKLVASLTHTYKKTDYFDELFPVIENILVKKWELLVDLNVDLLNDIFSLLDITAMTELTSDMEISSLTTTGRIIDICRNAGATEYLSGKTGRDYLDIDLFEKSGIKLSFHDFEHPVYNQRFGEFIPNLSIIDYLMNNGTKSWLSK